MIYLYNVGIIKTRRNNDVIYRWNKRKSKKRNQNNSTYQKQKTIRVLKATEQVIKEEFAKYNINRTTKTKFKN